MQALHGYLDNLTFTEFMPQGKLHTFIDHHFGQAGELLSDADVLTRRMGVYSGDYLFTWLRPIMNKTLGVTTFEDLKITPEEDPGMSLPENKRYRLCAHLRHHSRRAGAAAVGLRLRRSGPRHPGRVAAVRASMSAFFFEPVTFDALPADITVPVAGAAIPVHYDGGTVTSVDGGMLRNFPINAFDREDGAPPRWPTIGVKLSSLQTRYPSSKASTTAYGRGAGCLHTMMNEWDAYSVDAATAGRTIFVDNAGVGTTEFDLSQDKRDELFVSGVTASTNFIIEMGGRGHVPRSEAEARQLVLERRPAS